MHFNRVILSGVLKIGFSGARLGGRYKSRSFLQQSEQKRIGGLYQVEACGSEKWLDFGYIVKVELMGFFDGLIVGCRDRDGTKGYYKIP